MAKFEDNLSPYLTVVEQGSTPANPAAGDQKLFVKTSDHLLYFVNSAGVVTAVGGGTLSDQGVITYLDGTVAAAPGTPAAGKLRLYAKTGKVLAVKDDAGVETVLGTGGGGAPTTSEYLVGTADGGLSAEKVKAALYRNYDPDEYPASPNAENNEFDTNTTGWAWVSTAPTTVDVTTFPGFLYIESASQLNGPNFFRESYAPGASTAFCIAAKIAISEQDSGGNNAMQFGLSALDSGDAEIKQIRIADSGAASDVLTTRLVGPDGVVTTYQIPLSGWIYLVLARDASNNYTGWFSLNGVTWIQVGAASASATTVAKVGFNLRTANVADPRYAMADFFRRFATATPPFKIGA